VERLFSKRGAYGHYKDLLDKKGLLQDWYQFESAEERVLREWCRKKGLLLEC